MDLTTFFAQAKQNVVVPVQEVQKVQKVQEVVIHTKSPASRKAPPKKKASLPTTKSKNVKSSSKHVKSPKPKPPKPKSNGPLSPKKSPQLDTNDPDLEEPLDAEADADAEDFDDAENDSQWGGDGDEVHDADSPCGSQFGDDDLAGDDIDEPVTYDIDLEPSYAKLGAWKRRDKSTLPKPEFVGPPLTPDDDAHIF